MQNTVEKDLERSIIGYMFMPEIHDRIPSIELDNFSDNNRRIVQSVKKAYLRYGDVSLMSVNEIIKDDYPMLANDLISIVVDSVTRVTSPVGFDSTFKSLIDKRNKIKSLLVIRQAYSDAKEGNYKAALSSIDETLQRLSNDEGYFTWVDIDDLIEMSKVEIIPSAIQEYNRQTGGYFRKQIHTFAARPGHGKTTHSANELVNLGIQKLKTVYFSLEMASEELMSKVVSISGQIDNRTLLRGGTIPMDNLLQASSTIDSIKNYIFIYDNIYEVGEMIGICKEKKPDVVIVDFLQSMDFGKYTSLRLGILEILVELKKYAKRDNVAIILYSQMSREIEKRQAQAGGNGKEQESFMSDAAESQYIEVISGYLTFMQWKYLVSHSDLDRNVMVMDVKKARFGGFGRIRIWYSPEMCLISPKAESEKGVPF